MHGYSTAVEGEEDGQVDVYYDISQIPHLPMHLLMVM
jgi:hypothetical protein